MHMRIPRICHGNPLLTLATVRNAAINSRFDETMGAIVQFLSEFD